MVGWAGSNPALSFLMWNNEMINYNTLKQIQRNERSRSNLTKVPQNFYEGCAYYFYKLNSDGLAVEQFRMYKNALNCYNEIVERRLHKLTQKAYFQITKQTSPIHKVEYAEIELPENIIKEEIKIFNSIISMYKTFYGERQMEYENLNIDVNEL